MIGVFLD